MKILRVVMCVVTALAIVISPANAMVQVNDRTVISFTINGNNASGFFHFQPQGISGTGETTGAKYQGTGATQESFTNSFQNGQANETFINNFRIIGQGPGNNFLVHETLHFTINADGTVTVFHDNFSVDCK